MDLNTAPAAMRFNRRTSRPNMQHFPQQRNHRVESGLNFSFQSQGTLSFCGLVTSTGTACLSLCVFSNPHVTPHCSSFLHIEHHEAHIRSLTGTGGPKVDDFLGWAKLKTVNFWACFEGELPLQDAVTSNVSLSSSRCPRPRAAQQGFPSILRSTPLWARLCLQAQIARVFPWAFPLRVPWTPLESRRRGTLPRVFQFTCLTATWSGSQSGNRDRWCR